MVQLLLRHGIVGCSNENALYALPNGRTEAGVYFILQEGQVVNPVAF